MVQLVTKSNELQPDHLVMSMIWPVSVSDTMVCQVAGSYQRFYNYRLRIWALRFESFITKIDVETGTSIYNQYLPDAKSGQLVVMLLNIIDEKTSFRWFWPRQREMLWWLDQDEEAGLHLSPDLYCQRFICSSFDKLVGTSPSPTSPSNNLSKLTLLLLRLWDRDFFSPLIRIIFFNLERGAATFPAMFKDNERETRQWTLKTAIVERNEKRTWNVPVNNCLLSPDNSKE